MLVGMIVSAINTEFQTVTFRVWDSGFGSVALLAGDRDGGRLHAQVPGLVSGAHSDRIVPAILIIPVSLSATLLSVS